VKGTKQDASSLDGQSGRHLAERWDLPYREAHTLSIDPAALEIIDREESRRLRVLPVEFGPDGPIFAVAEPSEERFAAVRDLAGDNASFVVVARETLDALLNSKVFSVPTAPRRPSLFRRPPVGVAAAAEAPQPAPVLADDDPGAERPAAEQHPAEQPAEAPAGEAYDEDTSPPEPEQHQEEERHAPEFEPTPVEHHAGSTEALDSLLTQIATGTGNLRAQVDQLTESLETAQGELREANEQLAETSRIAETHQEAVAGLKAEHDQVVAGLRSEIEQLRAELAKSTSLNEAMTGRLEEVARALMPSVSAETTEG
jgi:Type II secretion system (T2SS), protein E, N-terminal domain